MCVPLAESAWRGKRKKGDWKCKSSISDNNLIIYLISSYLS